MRAAFVRLPAAGALALCALLSPAFSARAEQPPPAADVSETFDSDLAASGLWEITGPIAWDAVGKTALSSSIAPATAVWTPGLHYAGSLSAKVKLIAGRPAKAGLLFGLDPGSGDYRWVRLTAGAPGSVALGTTTAGVAKTVKSFRLNVPLKKWLTLKAAFDGAGKVTVSLGTKKLFTAAVGPPTRPGRVGIVATKSKAAFDAFAFAGAPDTEPCADCHRGQAAGAPEVYTYWDGSWWDANGGGTAGVQQGGHGDPGGKAAVACAGANGCHDLRLPDPGAHRNGVAEPSAAPSENHFHLRAGFISRAPGNAWDAQVTFDNFCALQCHKGSGIADMRHERDTQPGQSGHGAVQLGTHSTYEEPLPESGLPVDHDITTAAGAGAPRYVVCVSCHDPHGTGVAQVSSRKTNLMMRVAWDRELCVFCHK